MVEKSSLEETMTRVLEISLTPEPQGARSDGIKTVIGFLWILVIIFMGVIWSTLILGSTQRDLFSCIIMSGWLLLTAQVGTCLLSRSWGN